MEKEKDLVKGEEDFIEYPEVDEDFRLWNFGLQDKNIFRYPACLFPVKLSDELVPCGKCLLCRTRQKREWGLRCDLEGATTVDSAFITLTFNEDNVPFEVSLQDIQVFMREVRRLLPYKVRYFAAGEYGDKFGRSHYHFILFGLKIDDYDVVGKVWDKGFITIKPLSSARCNYVAGYVQKKIDYFSVPTAMKKIYKMDNIIDRLDYIDNHFSDFRGNLSIVRQPPFATCSNRPGIGKDFYEEHKDHMNEYLTVAFNGRRYPIPRYFRKFLEVEFPEFKERFFVRGLENSYEKFEKYGKNFSELVKNCKSINQRKADDLRFKIDVVKKNIKEEIRKYA